MYRKAKPIGKLALIFSTIVLFLTSAAYFASLAQSGCQQQNCDGLPGLPPQSPPARSYSSFIQQAYMGAYGRFATCNERRAEAILLTNAAANGSFSLQAEARRFVATLFMTQASYDAQDLTTYTQTAAYEGRNPQGNTDRASVESFVTDLYRAFLQREPDAAGHCFWSNDVCANNEQGNAGRKHAIRAFELSIEFGNLVNGLFDTGPVCCPRHCSRFFIYDCELDECVPNF